jgi:hypothetical protein
MQKITNARKFVRFEALTAVTMKNGVEPHGGTSQKMPFFACKFASILRKRP